MAFASGRMGIKNARQQRIVNGIAITVGSALVLYLAAMVVRMERFLIDERCTRSHCDAIRSDIMRLEAQEIPPVWFKEQVGDLKRRVERIESRGVQ